ncbi:MAG: hypothetical protein Q4C49_02500 [Bacillota bacterium]|nr:hypothetical protein [Bacillota bacterium]
MGYFAVLDTETNWKNEVMSIGIVLADEITMEPFRGKYIVIDPAYKKGGLFSSVLFIDSVRVNRICSYQQAIEDILDWFALYGVKKIFAYNAGFDFSHLPQLQEFEWYDILRLAAYKEYNSFIHEQMPCFKTGRLKRNYGVEPILQLLSKNEDYREVHNALCDALDELKIMQYLSHPLEVYKVSAIKR